MLSRSKWPPLFIAALFLIATAATLLAPDAGPRGVCVASAVPDGRTLPNILGTWTGTWEDTVYQWASGPMTWTITLDQSDYWGSGSIDLSVLGFGLGDQEGGASGSLTREDRQSLSFSYYADLVGGGDAVLTGTSCAGSGVVNAPLDFGYFTFSGTITDTAAIGRFFFASPTGGAGRVTMTKDTPVESTTWGSIKAGYRNDDE